MRANQVKVLIPRHCNIQSASTLCSSHDWKKETRNVLLKWLSVLLLKISSHILGLDTRQICRIVVFCTPSRQILCTSWNWELPTHYQLPY